MSCFVEDARPDTVARVTLDAPGEVDSFDGERGRDGGEEGLLFVASVFASVWETELPDGGPQKAEEEATLAVTGWRGWLPWDSSFDFVFSLGAEAFSELGAVLAEGSFAFSAEAFFAAAQMFKGCLSSSEEKVSPSSLERISLMGLSRSLRAMAGFSSLAIFFPASFLAGSTEACSSDFLSQLAMD